MGLLESRSLTVTMDYGQFHLVSGFPSPNDVSGEEQERSASASTASACCARTRTTSRWRCSSSGGTPSRPTTSRYQPVVANEQWDLHVPAGTYAVRITGRGFVARGWPGTTTPGDEWRIQLWPGAAAPPEAVGAGVGARFCQTPVACSATWTPMPAPSPTNVTVCSPSSPSSGACSRPPRTG
jgi:hypothetical protein